jgi:hypothetical protein
MRPGWELLAGCARKGTYLLLVCASLSASFAASPSAPTGLSIDQFDRLLTDLQQENDAKIARRIAGIHLTERADAAQMARWQARLSGDRSRKALMEVVDASEFLAPPASETPLQPQPDAESTKQMRTRMWNYVRKTLPRFPDLFADRTTTSFAFTTDSFLHPLDVSNSLHEAPRGSRFKHEVLGPGRSSDSLEPQLFYLGSWTQEVTYRGGNEVANSPQAADSSPALSIQMTTSGEFGSILGLVLTDFSPDQVVWSHWERGPKGPVAVFSYSVPSAKSHFAVTFTDEPAELPAYHGEIAIDPASGVIWHMTLLATTSGMGFFRESFMLVEFAFVEIGGVAYVCPVHSVAMNRYFDTFEYSNTVHTPVPFASSINDVSFTHYHLFRSQTHIITGATAK